MQVFVRRQAVGSRRGNPAVFSVVRLFLSLAFILCSKTNLSAEPNVSWSRPAGFIQVTIPAKGETLLSMPFNPFDSSLNSMFANQLTGSTNETSADRVLKWDAASAQYATAVRAAGTGEPEIEGKWFADLSAYVPSDMTFSPGEGFIIENRQEFDQTLFLSGEVVLDPSNTVVLLPKFNLLGYPYTTAREVSETALPAGAELIDTLLEESNPMMLAVGGGYWLRIEEQAVWTELCPYGVEMFSAAEEPPLITGLSVVNSGECLKLAISCAGIEKVDVFARDLSETGRLDTVSGWRIAELDIPTEGAQAIEWTDMQTPVSDVPGRLYLIGRADVDSDGDGIPDARERFVYGAKSLAPETSGANQTAAAQQETGKNNDAVSDEERARRVRGTGVIYVDCATGDDSFDGASELALDRPNLYGPKKTINAALRAANNGDVVYVAGGEYSESVRNSNVRMIATGRVVLR